MSNRRFDRNTAFFGAKGQAKLRATTVCIVGIGGLGSRMVQEFALLGVGTQYQIDHEQLDDTNRNRYVTARFSDPVPGTWKVDIGERLGKSIDPEIKVEKVYKKFNTEEGYAALKEADIVIGCLDSEGARLVLLEVCAVLKKPYLDLATEIIPGDPTEYGGRLCFSFNGQGCLSCRELLDRDEAGRDLAGEVEAANREAIYGIPSNLLEGSGPSVGPLNAVIAAHTTMELMAFVTGLRPAKAHLNFNGRLNRLTASLDLPAEDCYFCHGLFTGQQQSNIERYFGLDLGGVARSSRVPAL